MDNQAQSKGLREERANIHKQMQDLLELVKTEERSLTAEELTQFDRWHAACDDLERQFKTLERAAAELAKSDAVAESQERQNWEAKRDHTENTISFADEDMAFRGWLTFDTPYFTPEMARAIERCGVNPRPATREFVMPHIGIVDGFKRGRKVRRTREDVRDIRRFAQNIVTTRATTAQTITTTAGGNLIANDNSFMSQLQETLLSGGTMRQVATIVQTQTGATLPIPGTAGNDKGAILAINTAAVTQDTSFTQQTLGADKYTSNMIKLPGELVQDSAIPIQSFVAAKVGDRINRIQEEMWATGSASLSEPEGLVTTGSSGGAAAGTTQSSEASITVTDLTNLEHGVDPAYRADSQWMFSDSVLKNLKQQLDGNNRPLWQPALTAGEPDLLFGHPYFVNQEYGAFTGTSANASKLMTFGPHSHYWVRDVAGVDVRVLRERFGELDQIAVIGFARADGEYINPNGGSSLSSIKYMQSAAS